MIVPTTWDKPDNARRITEAGAGIRLSPKKCTPQSLRAAVDEVLGTPSYRVAAQRLGAALLAAPGPARSAELLEQLAGAGPGSGTSSSSGDTARDTARATGGAA